MISVDNNVLCSQSLITGVANILKYEILIINFRNSMAIWDISAESTFFTKQFLIWDTFYKHWISKREQLYSYAIAIPGVDSVNKMNSFQEVLKGVIANVRKN